MKIKRFNENLDGFLISPITFTNSRGIEKIVYPSVIMDFIKTSVRTKENIRKEMDNLMWNQGFSTPPKFVDNTGNMINNHNIFEINDKYPGFKWVFFVEEKNLEKAEQISNKFGVEFYKNK
jgi:hypothetical protein